MFDKFVKLWQGVEDKLPGFRYFTATFLVLAAIGYVVLKYRGVESLWFVIPGFFLTLMLVLFLWLVITIVNPPAGDDVALKWMRRLLLGFVTFLFVGFVLLGTVLSFTIIFLQKPQAICNEIHCHIPPTPPDQHSINFAHLILRSRVASDWDHRRTEIFSDSNAMDAFLGSYACRYCKVAGYGGACLPDYTPQMCTDTHAEASAASSGQVARPLQVSQETGCKTTALARNPNATEILGIDLSHYDHDVDFKALAAKGVYFVYLKASQGKNFADAAFAERWKAAGEAGLIRGAYHTFTADDARAQALFFLSVLARVKIGPCDLGPALDMGLAQNLSLPTALPGALPAYIAGAGNWLEMVQNALSQGGIRPSRPMVYLTAHSVESPDLLKPLARYPLWLGTYAVLNDPAVPPPWTGYTFRQFSDGKNGRLIEGLPYDVSDFRGSAADLFRLTR